jgi:hypothetical protein
VRQSSCTLSFSLFLVSFCWTVYLFCPSPPFLPLPAYGLVFSWFVCVKREEEEAG